MGKAGEIVERILGILSLVGYSLLAVMLIFTIITGVGYSDWSKERSDGKGHCAEGDDNYRIVCGCGRATDCPQNCDVEGWKMEEYVCQNTKREQGVERMFFYWFLLSVPLIVLLLHLIYWLKKEAT